MKTKILLSLILLTVIFVSCKKSLDDEVVPSIPISKYYNDSLTTTKIQGRWKLDNCAFVYNDVTVFQQRAIDNENGIIYDYQFNKGYEFKGDSCYMYNGNGNNNENDNVYDKYKFFIKTNCLFYCFDGGCTSHSSEFISEVSAESLIISIKPRNFNKTKDTIKYYRYIKVSQM